MTDSSPELTQEQIDEFLATVRLPLVTDAARRVTAWSTAGFGALLGVLAGSTWAIRTEPWSGLLWVALQTLYVVGLIALVVWRHRAARHPALDTRRTEVLGVGTSAVAAIALVTWIQFGGAPAAGPLVVIGAGLLTAAPSFVAAYRIAPEAFLPRR